LVQFENKRVKSEKIQHTCLNLPIPPELLIAIINSSLGSSSVGVGYKPISSV